jgi:hypothetical protein
MGATDVCPLIPVSGISMDETAAYARRLAERIAKEAGIPVYCYEYAAFRSERKKLAVCREGEYEGLKPRFGVPEQMPDFGGEKWTDRVIFQKPAHPLYIGMGSIRLLQFSYIHCFALFPPVLPLIRYPTEINSVQKYTNNL